MITLYALGMLLAAICSIILGLFVWLKNKKAMMNITWFLLSLSVAFWSFFYYLNIVAPTAKIGYLAARLLHGTAAFIPATFLHFTVSFLKINREKRKIVILGYIFATLISISSFTSLLIAGVRAVMSFKYYPTGGPIYALWVIYYFTFAGYAHYLVIKSFKKMPPAKQNQSKYLFTATAIGFLTGATTFFLFFNINVTPFGTPLVFIYTIIIAYSILKHQLLDINIVIRKGLIYSVIVTIITLSYFILIMLLENIFRGFVGYKSLPLTFMVVTIFILIFQPLKNRIQTFFDKLFFKGTLDSLEQERELMQQELIRSERLKAVATLAAGMAHEIKNPLTAIKTFTEHLKEKKDDPEFINKFERIVGGETDKINRIVHQLLDFAKPAPLVLEKININTLLDDILSLLSNDIIKHKIKLIKEYGNITDMSADPNQLKQAFLNLLLNAIEAMPNGGDLALKTSKNATNNKTEVIIQDTGLGIPKKELIRIFDPFYSTKDKGTGLGLSITYEIIKKHDGSIVVESEVKAGTTVRVIF